MFSVLLLKPFYLQQYSHSIKYAFKSENDKDKQQPTYYQLLYIMSRLKQSFIKEQLATDLGTEEWSMTAFQRWQLYEKRMAITVNDHKVKKMFLLPTWQMLATVQLNTRVHYCLSQGGDTCLISLVPTGNLYNQLTESTGSKNQIHPHWCVFFLLAFSNLFIR